VLITGVAFLFLWDLAGVANGIFFRGETPWMTGVLVAPEVPLEEVFFLTLLTYLTLNVFGAIRRGRKAAQ
jgi:lycopene cyclase domain-containing protein